MKKEFIVNRQGKDFALYAGLLDQAHREGLKRITTPGPAQGQDEIHLATPLLQAPTEANGQLAICYAEVETEKGIFFGIGDASPQNVGRMIAAHTVRMSETRAKARALRDAINAGVTALEELSDSEEPDMTAAARASQPGTYDTERPVRALRQVAAASEGTGPATPQQLDRLGKLQAALGRPKDVPEHLSFEDAAYQITQLVRMFNAQARGRPGESHPVPLVRQSTALGSASHIAAPGPQGVRREL